MRLQLNLNRYYEGLELSQVNALFSMFVDLKFDIAKVKYLLNCTEEEKRKVTRDIEVINYMNVFRCVKKINAYMVSIGKEEIFVLGDSWKTTDYEAIVSKYEYLMSEPDLDTH